MIRKKANVLSVGEEFTLSRAEAERRLKIEGYPSLEQIIQRTKAKADWPDERWDEIRRIAAAAEKPDALVVNLKTVFAHIRHCKRWVAAASSLIFVLAVLLIFIPESRAFAIQVYGGLRLRPQALVIRELPAIGSVARPCVSEQGSTIM